MTALRADGTVEERFDFEVERSGSDVELTVTCTADEPVEAGIRVELLLDPTDDRSCSCPASSTARTGRTVPGRSTRASSLVAGISRPWSPPPGRSGPTGAPHPRSSPAAAHS
jgi:hypothetical protein